MPITEQQLLQMLPNAGHVAGVFVPALNEAMTRYQINTPQRIAAFIAQVGAESGQLCHLVEDLSYSADRIAQIGNASPPDSRWRSLVPRAAELAHNPEAFGNAVYGGRMGNGAEATGDGFKYRGRGLLQLTGKDNYVTAGAALGIDLAANPDQLAQPESAALSAARFWSANGLNALADAGDLEAITKKINGGLNGEPVRLALYTAALAVLA